MMVLSQEVRIKNQYPLFLLLWLTGLFTFAVCRLPGGLDVDSCNYAVVAKEILRTNRWLSLFDPVTQGTFYYHFPLCIWITAIFFKLFGVSSFVAKLFSLISALALVAAIFYFGKFLKNQWVGFFAALSLVLTNHVTRLAMQCRMDIPVSLFISLAIFAFILAGKYTRRYYLFFGLFTCLAIFTKDVVGLFPLAIVFTYLLFLRRWKYFFHPLFILGIVLVLGPVLFWIWLDQGRLFGYWYRFNFLHLWRSPAFNLPWHYYLTAIFNKYFYFLPFALYGGYLAIKEARREKRPEFYLLLIWVLIFPLAFSFGRQKLHYFILPMYPAAALLVGLALDRLLAERFKLKTVSGLKYILLIATIVLLFLPVNPRSRRFQEAMTMAPLVDEILQQLPEYEFLIYKYDAAAMLFYSQQLTRVKNLNQPAVLEEDLLTRSPKTRVCFILQEDFLKLNPQLQERYRVVLRYKGRLLVVEKKAGQDLIVALP